MNPGQRLNLLIIDDHPEEKEVELLAQALERVYSVEIWPNADNILNTFQKYDALILDHDLGPGRDTGYDILKEILRIQPQFPAFAYIRSGQDDAIRLLYDAGCRGVWIKGNDPEIFIMRIGLTLGERNIQERLIGFIETTTVEDLKNMKNHPLERPLMGELIWGDNLDRARANISSNLCADAEVMLNRRDRDREAFNTLLKALILHEDCLHAVHVLAAGYHRGSFSEIMPAMPGLADFLRMSLQQAECKARSANSLVELYDRNGKYLFNQQLRADRDAALICIFADGLEYVDYIALLTIDGQRQLKHLGRLYDPRLVLPMKELRTLPSREYSILDDLVKRGKDYRIIRHREIEIEASSGVFGPAIDTLWLNEVLHEHIYQTVELNPECICELGCGSGLLLCSLLRRYKDSVKKVIAVDISERALSLAERNLAKILKDMPEQKRPDTFFLKARNSLDVLKRDSVDILVTNPPYLPPKPSSGTEAPNAISGVEVTKSVILGSGRRVIRPGGIAIVLRSSLTPDSDVWSEAHLKGWEVADLSEKPFRVPLDLLEVSGDPQYDHVTRTEGRRGLIVTIAHPSHQHWHELSVKCAKRIEG